MITHLAAPRCFSVALDHQPYRKHLQHHHSIEYELYYSLNGKGSQFSRYGQQVMQAGEVFLFPPVIL